MFKIPLSFYYTGWFLGISLLDYERIPNILGSTIPYNYQPTEVLNTAHVSSIFVGALPSIYLSVDLSIHPSI